ncbi:dihydropyrimidine dehydrogenase subunit A [Desulfosarcina alkanivorans]|uniref:Dihydropyrimidine dehydrogenase subunit A n=1 Tax=Desulfosarcina alkanivorans TaxID=571177 RepID=A0A5K7YQA4_9BACT|nr:glutamate synthase subunit beta [Desulfosarcina alkanivorans]BBO70069.1 dihydropyrimidine dehydrogenase subunit A [Desulfosarcina alkanivorans]
MGKPTGFMEHDRQLPDRRPVEERVGDFREIYRPFPEQTLRDQAARCMDCGVPTCHAGCPLGNRIPDWNDEVYHGRWEAAFRQLMATNNFPEFTGRLCPAPCEEACVLAINAPAVTIEQIEKTIIEKAFEKGWVRPQPPLRRTGKTVAVVGSGPAGLACAVQLNSAGHTVVVFERDAMPGGLLRYGIPDFKLEKQVVDRRLNLMAQEGIAFKTGVHAGVDLSAERLCADFDALVLCCGATRPRDLPIPGRELDGVHFAMAFLTGQNRVIAGETRTVAVDAGGRQVIVIGGGDTGSDCIGTSHRQGAASVINFELLPRPPEDRPESQPWPYWPMRLRSSSSHEEGGRRHWNVLTKRFIGDTGRVRSLETVAVQWVEESGRPVRFEEVPGSQRIWPADLVLLAMGFTGPEPDTIVARLDLALDKRGNIHTGSDYMTSRNGVFAAGDARRGQSLIVWAISEGREAARAVDRFLMGRTDLPEKECCDLPRR